MDPKITPNPSDKLPVISGRCCRRNTYPLFSSKIELLRAVTMLSNYPQRVPTTPSRPHDHPQLGSNTPVEGEVKGLPWTGHLARHGGLAGASKAPLHSCTLHRMTVVTQSVTPAVRCCSSCPGVTKSTTRVTGSGSLPFDRVGQHCKPRLAGTRPCIRREPVIEILVSRRQGLGGRPT